jgi:hypothetical protein
MRRLLSRGNREESETQTQTQAETETDPGRDRDRGRGRGRDLGEATTQEWLAQRRATSDESEGGGGVSSVECCVVPIGYWVLGVERVLVKW